MADALYETYIHAFLRVSRWQKEMKHKLYVQIHFLYRSYEFQDE
jgi:hypothetical protein